MTPLGKLQKILEDIGHVAIAVSGGVDSMTLAFIAHRHARCSVQIFHAVSAAVPGDATDRVRTYAAWEDWNLKIIGTEEFDDPNYRRNPVNRCLYCKTNLYRTIGEMTDYCVVSGTNTDDLSDYRPGLEAAKSQNVRHPFVEAGIDKDTVRELAAEFGLYDLAELPAAPCLASRVETGIWIEPEILSLVDRAEKLISMKTAASALRVRVRREGVVIEMNKESLVNESERNLSKMAHEVWTLFKSSGRPFSVRVSEYQRGSAFLRGNTMGALQ